MAVASVAEYTSLLKNLLPPGPVWPRGDTTSLYAMLIEVWAAELARVDSRSSALITEADPRFCVESFQEWLTQWGLPDECIKLWSGANNTTLRKLLLWKIKEIGTPTPDYFIELASMFGYDITIDEFFAHNVTSRANEVIADERWPNTWRVNVLSSIGAEMTYHNVMGGAEEALAWWGDNLIECLIKRYAPAHTTLYFGYFEDAKTES